MLYAVIVLLPLGAAIIAGLFGRLIGDRGANAVTCLAVIASAVLSIIGLAESVEGGSVERVVLFTWFESGSFTATWQLRIDALTGVMLVTVSGVSALVHVYSIGYMAHDPHKPRFMAYLSLFTFAMLSLVTADNLLQLFFGWEGVGLCSYLLIGFWYRRPAANAAAIKAFIVNRIGDFGFALGIMGVFLAFGAIDFDTIFGGAPALEGKTFSFLGLELDTLTTITFLLFLGAMGKSAQIGLHTWLPDAMEGPTPVSALIHAATMVTAGVFMVARLSPLFEYAPWTLAFVTVIGATTALMAATIGLVQNDIKRVIAYSTCSQLGYMFFAAGVSAYSAAIFHLFTHAFFKALLFLGSGAVIHAMADEQDMRKMGGLYRKLPVTYAVMWIGSLALAGVPIFAGFYSKDIILEAAFASASPVSGYAFWLGIGAAVLTAFYSWRVLFMTFHGAPRASAEVMAHAHEAPATMTAPLIVLALGAVLAGALAYEPLVGTESAFWGSALLVLPEHAVLEAAHHVPFWVKAAPTVVAVIGILAAWYMYIRSPATPARLAAAHPELYRFLLNKWYFDELYEVALVRPAKFVGYWLWRGGDGRVIDGFGPDGAAATIVRLARRASALQSGYLYHYAFAMLIGIALFVTWYIYRLGL
ncbi:MAG: NADH-quinone oxidoreductase subunit L [Alphaproteobacteria bacterium]|nr:NADH-quinone oxidoreductase subunit L [Alphaproteobacteria bacterium]